MADRIQQRRDTAARWAKYNPVLLEGEVGYVTDNPNQYKIGDGIHAWNELPLRGYTGTIVQDTGDDENAVMSQKAITNKLTKLEKIKGSFLSAYGILENSGVNVSDLQTLLLSIPEEDREPFATIQYRDFSNNPRIITYKSGQITDEIWGNVSNWRNVILDSDLEEIEKLMFDGFFINRDDVKTKGIYRSISSGATMSIIFVYENETVNPNKIFQSEIGQKYNKKGVFLRIREYDKQTQLWSEWETFDLEEMKNQIVTINKNIDWIKNDINIIGENIINANISFNGYISTSTGNISQNEKSFPNAKYSDLIPVVAGATYYLQGRPDGVGIVGYDSEGNKQIAIDGKTDYNAPLNGVIKITEGTENIRMTFTLSGGDYSQIMLSLGDEEKNFVPYSIKTVNEILTPRKNYVIRKESNKLNIYTHIKDFIYINWGVIRTNNEIDNVDYWRLSASYLCYFENGKFVDNLQILGFNENEFVFHIKGAEDSTGGYHGDEKFTQMGILIDGIYIDINDFPQNKYIEFENISYIEKSNMYDTLLNDDSVIAEHFKETKFHAGTYKTDNRVIFKKISVLDRTYGGLVCMHKNVGKYFLSDDFVIHEAVGDDSTTYPNSKRGIVKYYSEENNISAIVKSWIEYGYDESLLKLEIWDRTGDTKFYYRNEEDYDVVDGQDYMTSQEIKFFF